VSVPALSPTAIDEVVFEGETSRTAVNLMNAGENFYLYIIRGLAAHAALEATARLDASRLAAPADALAVDLGKRPSAAADAGSLGAFAPFSGNVSWLTAIDSLGMVPGRDTVGAAVSLDASPVAAGVYNAELLVLTNVAPMDSTTIPVRMRVPRMRYGDHVAGFRATVTDEGAFGFFDLGQMQYYGSGFVYPATGGSNILYHGSLWVGKDTLHVSDESCDYDFEVLSGDKLAFSGTSPRRSLARFTDAQDPSGLGVEVRQECLSYTDPAHDDFLVVNYTIKNASGASLSHVYAALWIDWDVGAYLNDRGRFDNGLQTGYMWNSVQSGFPYGGLTLLNSGRCASFHLVYNPTYVHPTGGVPDKNKYRFMSDRIVDTATAVTQDWSMVMSTGPYTLAPGDTARVSFALVGGATLQALLDNAAEARDLVGTGVERPPAATRLVLGQCYPNPFNPTTRIEFETPQDGRVQLIVYNVKGELVARIFDGALPAGRHAVTWNGRTSHGSPAASGVYFYRLSAERCPSLTRKMVLLR
jgi:hypothetical protein